MVHAIPLNSLHCVTVSPRSAPGCQTNLMSVVILALISGLLSELADVCCMWQPELKNAYRINMMISVLFVYQCIGREILNRRYEKIKDSISSGIVDETKTLGKIYQ